MGEKKMIRTRRVGTVTFGLLLIFFGILFLIHMFYPQISYEFIFRLWPLVFITLGGEVLAGSFRTEERFVYDGAAVFLMILLIVFAFVMAGLDWMFAHTMLAREFRFY